MLDAVDSTADIPPRARYSKPRVSCLHELLIFSSWCPSGGGKNCRLGRRKMITLYCSAVIELGVL